MSQLRDHPQRYALANELHARPFPVLTAPCHAVFLALKEPENAASRDPERDRALLRMLLDRFGAPHPQPDATHYSGDLGRHRLKWEQHTEFVTYTVFTDGVWDRPFDPAAFDVFPAEWLAQASGTRITSALIRVESMRDVEGIDEDLSAWFVPESIAVSRVLDGAALIAGDFRIDSSGHQRFSVIVQPGIGGQRVGRIVQRLCEIETYKSMSMLGLSRARELSQHLEVLDRRLSALMAQATGEVAAPEDTLHDLLQVSAEMERLMVQSSFRFGATGAYEAIVNQRIGVLREERHKGRQTFGEFMMRRFDPAMRTVKSTERRLEAMAHRAMRAGELLRTKVDVDRSAQNQQLLASMDRRADLQLKLQKTVEGLSVVAISYYAVNLAIYLAAPFGKPLALDKTWLAALLTPPVMLLVWWMLRRIHRRME